MNILQIVGIGLVATILIVIIRKERPDMALTISLTAGAIIFLLLIGNIFSIIGVMEDVARKANLDDIYFTTILKVLGIAYIAEFGSQLCKDAGESAIASKIELGGKIIIMILAMPILSALMDVILQIIP